MKRSIIYLVILVSFLLLNACGSTKELAKTETGDIPEWYLTPPTAPDYVFGTASSTSKDMDLAISKATTEARANIARNIEIKINSMQKKFEEEVGQGENSELLSQFTQATKTVVSKELNGSQVAQKKLVKDGNNWRAYVLAKYPIGEAQKAFLNKIKDNTNLYTRFRSTEAFKELENEVNKKDNPVQVEKEPAQVVQKEVIKKSEPIKEVAEVKVPEIPVAPQIPPVPTKVETQNQVISIENYTFELLGCKLENKKITANLLIKNTTENDLELIIGLTDTKIFDESGNEYVVNLAKLANSVSKNGWSRIEKQTVPGIPTPAEFIFENISSKTTQISLLSIYIVNGGQTVKFRNIPLEIAN